MSEEKKAKWREILVPAFISSEESGEEQEQEGEILRPELYVKTLPWRSPNVTRFFQQLDRKVINKKSKRAKLQTLPRVPGQSSLRPKPVDEFASNHWAYAV